MNSTDSSPSLNPCDPASQQARQGALDALYLADGRDSKDHPLHSLYTGLLIQSHEPSTAAS